MVTYLHCIAGIGLLLGCYLVRRSSFSGCVEVMFLSMKEVMYLNVYKYSKYADFIYLKYEEVMSPNVQKKCI